MRGTIMTRREMMQGMGAILAGSVLSACAPTPPEETVKAEVTGAPARATVAEEVEPTVSPAKQEAVTIKFSGWGNVEELTLYENIAAAQMEENPNLKIENIGLPGNEYSQKLFTWIASGNPPDCIRVGTQYFPTLYAERAVLDLTPYFHSNSELLDDKLYMTDLYKIYTMDDKMYAPVLGPNVMALYYNVDMFENAGVEPPNMDWTYEDYTAAAIKMTRGEGTEKHYGATNAYWWMVWESILWANGGDLFDREREPTRCTLDSPEMVETCRWLQDLVFKDKAVPTAAEASGFEGGWNSGRIGLEINGTWAVNARRKIKEFNWDLAHLPIGAKERAACHAAGGIVIPVVTKHPDEAWVVAAYHEGDRAQELYARDGLNTPIMRKWAESDVFLKLEGAPPHHKVRVDAMEYSRNRDFYFEKWSEVRDKVFGPEMDKLMTNSQSPEETAANMATGAQALLEA